MKYEDSENRFFLFRERFPINSFIINDVYKNLKENVNIKVKNKHKEVFVLYTEKVGRQIQVVFYRIMNEKDFNFDAITRFQAY